jgi:hypothetical protein
VWAIEPGDVRKFPEPYGARTRGATALLHKKAAQSGNRKKNPTCNSTFTRFLYELIACSLRPGVGRQRARLGVLLDLNGRMVDLEFGMQVFTNLLKKCIATGCVRHFQMNG